MSIDGDSRFVECGDHENVGRFSTDPRKGHQRFEIIRQLAVVLFDENFSEGSNIFRFIPEKTSGMDFCFENFRVGIGPIRSGAVFLEERRCYFVDAYIRALSGQNSSNG